MTPVISGAADTAVGRLDGSGCMALHAEAASAALADAGLRADEVDGVLCAYSLAEPASDAVVGLQRVFRNRAVLQRRRPGRRGDRLRAGDAGGGVGAGGHLPQRPGRLRRQPADRAGAQRRRRRAGRGRASAVRAPLRHVDPGGLRAGRPALHA
ncbi:protein of unknown function (plasmid) [Azospirillum baldaniorum]|uniref:Thiolase N-terminal domain-containing protein n=1 Tax=Azospirillum baldaniorum TaxID=1064539 RepID=A0A9P1NQT6_9PROT|nr:protein of unknown function [Azospirillum baldaniorum]